MGNRAACYTMIAFDDSLGLFAQVEYVCNPCVVVESALSRPDVLKRVRRLPRVDIVSGRRTLGTPVMLGE
jgi:hypothetical protein